MLNILYLLVFLYVAIGCALYAFQRSFIYFPVTELKASNLAEVTLKLNNIQLQGFVANNGQASLLLYFGGNAEQIAPSIAELSQKFPDVTIVGFYYRGYGGSQGEPSEQGLFSDAVAIYDKMAREYQKVVVMGRSLGSSVAVYLAKQRKVDRLVLVTPFDSILNIAKDMYWYYPIRWMLRDKFESVKLAPELDCPTLVLIAAEDATVPNKYTDNLMQHLPQNLRQSQRFARVGHNNIESAKGFYSTISEFIH